jgi:TM2 domain-containing membrane protein YozV
MHDQPQAPAGWYPAGGVQRYWDGGAWTEHTAPIASPQDARPYAARPYTARGLVQTPYGMMPATQVAPKNPALALLASVFVPGLGTMLNGEGGKGAGILIGYLVCIPLSFVLVGIPGMLAFWVWGMVDGYQGAQRWNARYGILS